LQDVLEDVADGELTVENVGGDEERAFDEAWRDLDHGLSGIAVERNINLSRLDEERVKDLIAELQNVETAWSEAGDHDGAKSALEIRNKIEQEAISEGIIDG